MCEYCGCREVEPIAELMDEHAALASEAYQIRQALGGGDRARAVVLLEHLAGHLDRHVRREEAGVFTALRDKGEFLDELSDLEDEHRSLDGSIVALDVSADGFEALVTQLLDDLSTHVEREELGIFPVSVVTLGADGWALVERSRTESPTFLLDPATT